MSIYLTDGRFVPPAAAIAEPLLVAASNWHALATFAGRFAHRRSPAMLLDIGSTTTDLIPLVDGRPSTVGRTDPQRLASGELVYTGIERSPISRRVCAARGAANCPVAKELFATTWDAYLLLGELPEEPLSLHTADGRPATRACAADRLARMILADRTMFDDADALARRGRSPMRNCSKYQPPPGELSTACRPSRLWRLSVAKASFSRVE